LGKTSRNDILMCNLHIERVKCNLLPFSKRKKHKNLNKVSLDDDRSYLTLICNYTRENPTVKHQLIITPFVHF